MAGRILREKRKKKDFLSRIIISQGIKPIELELTGQIQEEVHRLNPP